MLVNTMAEEVQLCNIKQALVGVDDDPMRGESGENCSQVIKVLFWGGAGDENIVNVGVGHLNATEDLIHEKLKHLGSVVEYKWQKVQMGWIQQSWECWQRPLGTGGRPGPGPAWKRW